MIKIEIKKDNDKIVSLSVNGHANYAKHGEDIVCAGVSCIMYGLNNALCELSEVKFSSKVAEGLFEIKINEDDQISQIVLKTAIVQLETIQSSYSKYIKIRKVEV